jgi:thiamine monophosphate kinase
VDEAALPLNRGCTTKQAIADGEDYELLFAISPRHSARLLKSWRKKFPKLLLTRIGKLNSAFGIRHSKFPKGYVHFKER